MTSCSRGDVVLVSFPYSDLKCYKKRPALIVQDERVETGSTDRLLLEITSAIKSGATRVLVRRNTQVGRAMGILHDSEIVAHKIATVEEAAIEKKIGACTDMVPVDQALRAVLGLL